MSLLLLFFAVCVCVFCGLMTCMVSRFSCKFQHQKTYGKLITTYGTYKLTYKSSNKPQHKYNISSISHVISPMIPRALHVRVAAKQLGSTARAS